MNNESNLVLEIWETVRDHIAGAKRLDVATAILRSCEEYGMDRRDLQDVLDEEPYLTQAYREVFEDDIEEDEIEDEED